MFEEGQLYSAVTTHDDGTVEVHLSDNHPGLHDAAYRARRGEIAAASLAHEPGTPLPVIGLHFVAAFIDETTDYYEHTGIQSVARSLIERAVNEI